MAIDTGRYQKQNWCDFESHSFNPKKLLEPYNVATLCTARGLKVVTPSAALGAVLWSDPSQSEPTYGVIEPSGIRLEANEYFVHPLHDKPIGFWNSSIEDEFERISTAPELAQVLTEINDLAFQVEGDDFGLLRPSFRALTACMKTILDLARVGELLFPSDISTDRNGDIRISWAADDRETELVFPSDDKHEPYIYYSSPTLYDTVTEISQPSISKWVYWALRGL